MSSFPLAKYCIEAVDFGAASYLTFGIKPIVKKRMRNAATPIPMKRSNFLFFGSVTKPFTLSKKLGPSFSLPSAAASSFESATSSCSILPVSSTAVSPASPASDSSLESAPSTS